MDPFYLLCLCLSVILSCLFLTVLWPSAGKGMTPMRSDVWCFLVRVSLSHMVSGVRCGT